MHHCQGRCRQESAISESMHLGSTRIVMLPCNKRKTKKGGLMSSFIVGVDGFEPPTLCL